MSGLTAVLSGVFGKRRSIDLMVFVFYLGVFDWDFMKVE